ncbi:MAG: sodium:solute symporter [Bacteroidales bacterium]|jgi:SSS family solute:Na+ symporter|nr:sodium:solute symporter [Bacteroidales bacterium]MCI2134549.1 sodium:solute symporter [Bacteroidales bacterium]
MAALNISVWDCVIILAYIVLIIWWGLRHARSDSAGSYFLAGRSMPWWVVGLSLFAASISSTTLIGQAGYAYNAGVAPFNYNLIGVVVLVFFATFILPLYIRSGIFTIPEFLEKRYDKKSRYYFSAVSIIGNIFLDAAGALYAAALIIKLVFPEVDLRLIIAAFAIVAASYTIPGGLSSAISTELVQAVILIIGSIILTIACFANGGGEYLASLLSSGDLSIKLVRPLTDAETPWLGLIVGMPVSGIYFWANNQTLVQRVLSAKNVDEGRKGVMLAGFLTLTTLFIIVFPGIIARKLFPGIEIGDMVYPTMVMKLLPVGLLGIMLAALLAALTSTMSAILNSTSTLFTMDFYAKFNPRADQKKLVAVGKIAATAIVLIAALWAPQIEKFGSLLKYYQEMLSYLAPPVVAAFLMGIFCRRVNAKGAFIGLLSGLVVAVALLIWKDEIFGGLHFLYVIPILLIFSMMVIYLSSLASPAPSPEKLESTMFKMSDFRDETAVLRTKPWYSNYRVLGGTLLVACALMLFVLR